MKILITSWLLLLGSLGIAQVAPDKANIPESDGRKPNASRQDAIKPPFHTSRGRNLPDEKKGSDLPSEIKQPAVQQELAEKQATRKESEFEGLVKESLGHALPVFGQDLFQNAPSTFAPVDRVPVTADYVIGPGDELLVRAWGSIDLDLQLTVDRNGQVHIPKVGTLNVAGLRYEQLPNYVRSNISRIYKDFDLTVTLGELRSIQVFVVGYANHPGSYTVGSLSTLVNVVFAAGGSSVAGSMRSVQLRRNGKTVAEFDLYELLLRGDKSKDSPVLPGDVIFIPPVGKQVAIDGSVQVPGIYEMRDNATLGDLIEISGGLTAAANL